MNEFSQLGRQPFEDGCSDFQTAEKHPSHDKTHRRARWGFDCDSFECGQRERQSQSSNKRESEGGDSEYEMETRHECSQPCRNLAGATVSEPADSSVTGQRSNQLNYVPNFVSYRKPAYLLAFLRFNRVAGIACFNPMEPNFEVNGHHGHRTKPPSKSLARPNTNPEQLSLLREGIVAEAIQVGTGSELRILAHFSAQTGDNLKKQASLQLTICSSA